jgi:ubiquinone/menaquinone biosynthesis C-methylase UbiE
VGKNGPKRHHPGTLLDVAGGTGIVSSRLAARGHQVAVTDLIIEMLRHAQARLHGAAACMDARNLPQAEASDFFRSRVGPKRIARSPGGRSGDW